MQKVGVGVHYMVMEGELYNAIQKPSEQVFMNTTPEAKPLPQLSFIPPELLKKDTFMAMDRREKCAFLSVIAGGLAVVSWIVILFGVLLSTAGIIFSIFGLKSNHSKYAKIGLGLSVLGLVASFWYLFAASHGMINYNYFTSEFWEASSGVEKGVK